MLVDIEKKVIINILEADWYYYQSQSYGLTESCFTDFTCRKYYKEILNYIDLFGEVPNFEKFTHYLVDNRYSGEEINKVLTSDYVSKDINYVITLVDFFKEKQAKELIKNTKETGIEYVFSLYEGLSKIILEVDNLKQKSIKEEIEYVLTNIEKMMKGESNSDYLETGLERLDKKIIGLYKGGITIIAGRPGHGKTTLALQIAKNLTLKGYKGAFFSIEMPLERILIKELSEQSGINSIKLLKGDLTDYEFESIKYAAKKIGERQIFFDDNPRQSANSIKTKILLWKHKYKIDYVFIDYFTLIKSGYGKDKYREELNELSSDLRIFARNTRTPIVILSQLNRLSDMRKNKKPEMQDLKETSKLEEDADTVILNYMPDNNGETPDYLPEYNYLTHFGEHLRDEEYLELIIPKSRNGSIGIVPVRYEKPIHRITDITLEMKLILNN